MKVIILCAGYATRLYPLTENMPKPLLPVGSKPILEWILERVQKVQSVQAVYVVSNQKFAGHFETWAAKMEYPWPVEVVNESPLAGKYSAKLNVSWRILSRISIARRLAYLMFAAVGASGAPLSMSV